MRSILIVVLLLASTAIATFTITPASGTIPVTTGAKKKLSLVVTETPTMASQWTLYYNTTGPTGGGIGLDNWAAADANLNMLSGTSFDVNNVATSGTVRGQTTYSTAAYSFPTLLKDNLYIKAPATIGTMLITLDFDNGSGVKKAVKFTVPVTLASPGATHTTSVMMMIAFAVICLVAWIV